MKRSEKKKGQEDQMEVTIHKANLIGSDARTAPLQFKAAIALSACKRTEPSIRGSIVMNGIIAQINPQTRLNMMKKIPESWYNHS